MPQPSGLSCFSCLSWTSIPHLGFTLNPEIGTTDFTDDTDFKALGAKILLTHWVRWREAGQSSEISESVSSVSSVVPPSAVFRFYPPCFCHPASRRQAKSWRAKSFGQKRAASRRLPKGAARFQPPTSGCAGGAQTSGKVVVCPPGRFGTLRQAQGLDGCARWGGRRLEGRAAAGSSPLLWATSVSLSTENPARGSWFCG